MHFECRFGAPFLMTDTNVFFSNCLQVIYLLLWKHFAGISNFLLLRNLLFLFFSSFVS